MSKISDVGMAQCQPVGDLERWKALERRATQRAAVFHGDLRAIAEVLGVVDVADETLLRGRILEAIAKRGESPAQDMPAEPVYLPQPGDLGHCRDLGAVRGDSKALESARALLALPYGKVFNERGHAIDEGWLIGDGSGLVILRGREYGTTWQEGVCYYPRGSRFEAEEEEVPEVSPETSDRLRHLGFGGRP